MWTSGSLLRGTNHHRFSHMTIRHCGVMFIYISSQLQPQWNLNIESEPVLSSDWTAEARLQLLQSALMRAAHYSLKTLKQIFLISWHERASVTSAAFRIRLRADVFEPQLVVLKVSRPRFVWFFCQSLKHFQENAKNQKKNLQTSADNVISISSSSSAISEHRTSTHLYKRTYTSCSIKTLK